MKPAFLLFLLIGLLQSLIFAQSPSNNSLSCPTIWVEGPSSSSSSSASPNPNEKFVFVLKAGVTKGFDVSKLTFRWFNTGGKLLTGQGTQSVTIEPDNSNDITTTVEVSGLPQACPNRASISAVFDRAPQAEKVGEIKGLSSLAKKVKAHKQTKKRIVRKSPDKFTSH